MLNELKAALKRVRCYHTKNNLESILKTAEKNSFSYVEFLNYLLLQECEKRDQNRITKYKKRANFPAIKLFEEFDFSYQHSVSKRQINNWKEMVWIDNRENKIFMGPPGVGKTHLAIACGFTAITEGYKVIYYTLNDLMDELIIAEYENNLKRKLKNLVKNDLLIIDELGFLPMNSKQANLFFQLVNEFYEFKSIIITSNKMFSEWGGTFGDQVLVTAILDRLLHHAETVIMEGDSYRLKGKLK